MRLTSRAGPRRAAQTRRCSRVSPSCAARVHRPLLTTPRLRAEHERDSTDRPDRSPRSKIDFYDREIARAQRDAGVPAWPHHARFDGVSARIFDPVSVVTRLFLVEPGIARRVLARVVGVEIDEAPVDLPISDFEDVAPATGSVLRNVGAPRPIAVLAVNSCPHRQRGLRLKKSS